MSLKNFTFLYNDVSYEVEVLVKKMKNIRFRFRNGKFIVSCPRFVNKGEIERGLNKFAPRLISCAKKSSSMGDDFIYLFGDKVSLKEEGEITFSSGEIVKYKDHDDLKKKLKKFFLQILTERTRYYESIMKILPNVVRVREMTSRYGSNSIRRRSITFAFTLIHYSMEIIDAIIVHELAHCYVPNHSEKFYNIVYQYCPNYKVLNKRLRKGIHK